ncbi:hypothetical protein CS063_14230 [Sporanaerobium hydrogeniformans]|uniref:Uncharacterized protein n=1 Tax=Sporanaerobium hydrogeniformans TaxID=3072179 RepID=A0AC61DAI7_9FIRM|nr:hypothetical protein [Sporanaerobium hydrogeniformans]PHV69748.1 hypothetical protein CS063_14230 [Sporanaerobium hydrogeniformans]
MVHDISKAIDNTLIPSVDFSSEDKLILGFESTFSRAITLLEVASKQKSKNNETIYITYNNDLNISDHHYKNLGLYRDILFKVIANGWHILLLINLNKNVGKMIKFIHFILPLIVTGKFTIHYTYKYENTTLFDENIIVPNLGALSFISMNVSLKNSYAFYIQNPVAINILQKHFKEFISLHSKPLLNYYSNQKNINYGYYLVETEKNLGNRFLYKYSFSVLMLPIDLYTKLLQKKGLSPNIIQDILSFYHQRLDIFKANVTIYEYNDIYLVPSIHDLIRHQEFYLYDYMGLEKIHLEVQELIDFLENIIYLLRTFKNFNIAFIPPDAENLIKNHDLFCLVKEGHSVLIETFEFSKIIPRMRLRIEEPTVVRAFEEYLKDIWDKIPPITKDKKQVISWLLRQIDSLKAKLNND